MTITKYLLIVVLSLVAPGLGVTGRGSPANAETFSISGSVWEDKNADGVRQSSDPGMEGLPIELGKIANGVAVYNDDRGLPLFRDANGRLVRADVSGRYTFPNLEPGTYVVRIPVGGAGNPYFWTYPLRRGAGEFGISVRVESQAIKDVDFGLYFPKSDIARLRGIAWLNATPLTLDGLPKSNAIRAYIDGIDCTGPGGLLPTDQPAGSYSLGVVASSLIAGCGEPGKVVNFTIEGIRVSGTYVWLQGRTGPVVAPLRPPGLPVPDQQPIDLVAGPPFAYLTPELTDSSGRYFPIFNHALEVVVDGVSCGQIHGGPFFSFWLVVPSRELPGGCGYEGASIRLRLDGVYIGPAIPWHPGFIDLEPISVAQRSPLWDNGPVIRPPNAGDRRSSSVARV